MNWYLKVLRQYADFSGRARRKEYWMFLLFNIIISFVLGAIDGFIGTYSAQFGLGLFGGLYSLVILIPSLAVTVRRLHDTGRSGWTILLGLIPIVGAIILIVMLATEGKPGPNKYGANPKEVTV